MNVVKEKRILLSFVSMGQTVMASVIPKWCIVSKVSKLDPTEMLKTSAQSQYTISELPTP